MKLGLGLGLDRGRTRFGPGYDPNAAAFFSAAGVTSDAQKAAVNSFVLALKAGSVWPSMMALYPFLGNSATCDSFNLINPETFQITWNGTVNHDASGITGDGSTGYGDTGFAPATNLSNASMHIAVWNRTASHDVKNSYVGSSNTGNNYLICPDASGNVGVDIGSQQPSANAYAPGLICGSRTSLSRVDIYAGAISVANDTTAQSSAIDTGTCYICALNQGGADLFSDYNFALHSLGQGLNQAQMTAYNSAAQALQAALGR